MLLSLKEGLEFQDTVLNAAINFSGILGTKKGLLDLLGGFRTDFLNVESELSVTWVLTVNWFR